MLRRIHPFRFSHHHLHQEVVAVFKPSHVPLFSPLQALHDTFDINNDNYDSLTNRVLRGERQKTVENVKPEQQQTQKQKPAEEEEEEPLVRFDNNSSSLLPEAFQPKKSDTSSSSLTANKNNNNNMNKSIPHKHNNNSQEVRFPLPISDWFSQGVTLAARTPSSFSFLYHCACVGAIRREYHALVRMPNHIAMAMKKQQQQHRNETSENKINSNNNNNNTTTALLQLNPHIEKFNQLQRQKQSSLAIHDSNTVDKNDLLSLSKPITSSGLFLRRENYHHQHHLSASAAAISYSLAPSGWIQGATAKLSDLIQSKSYRPEIDELFINNNNNNSATQEEAQERNQNQNHSDRFFWTARRPHPFVRQSDILAPIKPALLASIGSAAHVDFQFVVQEDGFVLFRDNADERQQQETGEAVVHLKLNVLGLQSESSIRCALAAAGFAVVDDFEYNHRSAKSVDYQFAGAASLNPHQHFFDKSPRNYNKQSASQTLRPLAVDYNRMLTPTEMLIRKALIEEEHNNNRQQQMDNDDVSSNNHFQTNKPSLRPKLICSKIIFPSPTSSRNISILRHMVGASTSLRDLEKKARKRVPTQDTTMQFDCNVAEIGELPHEFDLRTIAAAAKTKNITIGGSSSVDVTFKPRSFTPKEQKLWLASEDSSSSLSDEHQQKEDVVFTSIKVTRSSAGGVDAAKEGKIHQEGSTATENVMCTYDPSDLQQQQQQQQEQDELERKQLGSSDGDDDIALRYRKQRDSEMVMSNNKKKKVPLNDDDDDEKGEQRHFDTDAFRSTSGSVDSDLGARQVILQQIRAAAENTQLASYQKRRSVLSTQSSAPGIHGLSNNNNRNSKCRYCFGSHPVSQCPKLGKQQQKK